MEVFEMESLAENGIIREDAFRESVEKLDWGRFTGKEVLLRGCGSTPVPLWAYLVVAARLAQHAQSLYFGETREPTPIFKRG